jgi:DNA recombination protein RmuC
MDGALLVLISVAALATLVVVAVLAVRTGSARSEGHVLRREIAEGLDRGAKALAAQMASIATLQNNQIDTFSRQLAELTAANERRLQELRETVDAKLRGATEDARSGREETAIALKRFGDTLGERFEAIRKDSAEQLERMRVTVDERLHSTLEQRLGESFKHVSDRLEAVHKGLGEMQALAADVGGLKRVLTNVKTRGTWGEVQLEALLEQLLSREQYEKNVATKPGSRERVEFAIRLPGRNEHGQVWLPIDSKFPIEDYERIVAATERADLQAVEEAARALEARLKLEAKAIREKYVAPPDTTDFALLFVPTEGLYAEAMRRPGLADALQREYRVTLVGPTNLAALLNSLQMGFRTLAIEKRSSEVWQMLGAVKTEFGRFGEVLAATKRQLESATRSIESAETRTRQMERKLKSVEALPEARAGELLEMPREEAERADDAGIRRRDD